MIICNGFSSTFLILVAAFFSARCLAQVPPIEDQHFFSPRMFKSAGDNEEIPFKDELFTIERTGPSDIGDNVTFSCRLPSGKSILNDRCTFYTPNGKKFFYDTSDVNKVFNDAEPGEPIPGIVGHDSGAGKNICGLDIYNVIEVYFGPWTCVFNDGVEDNVAHYGDFTILSKEEYYVKNVRLPRHIIPDHYDIELTPIIKEGNFTTSGSVKLTFTVSEEETFQSTNAFKIYMHAKDIAIDEGSVVVKRATTGDVIDIKAHEYGFERDFYIVHLKQPMPFNEDLTIEMKFKSYLNDYLVGFYRSKYVNEAGEEKYLAVTQFESHSARLAFPCLDEPDMKANFTVTLVTDKNLTAISNMNTKEVVMRADSDYKSTMFQTSVKMSTYLVAFLVSDFDFTENSKDETYKIWHQKSKKGQADLAAENGAKILEFYEKFFGIDYPLPKTDMAAIPDFSAGAMENWGLITYRETLLLYQDGISDVINKEDIIKVMAHELAHQWFGNLVTMKWWTDLWLNEGFATYTQYHGVASVFPEFESRDRMIIYDVQNVMGVDSLENSAPLSKEVTNPTYDAEFGAIAYSKGCSILRMAENFLTLDTFKKGVTNYLKSNEYGNAERDELWQALTDAGREDVQLPPRVSVKDIMDTWTLEPGYPVVTVVEGTTEKLAISQKRFYLNPDVESPADTTWIVPINVAYPLAANSGFNKTTPHMWLMQSNSSVSLDIQERPYVINVQQTGYYRVNYDDWNWQHLAQVLRDDHTKIHKLNRAQIIDDAIHLARSNQMSYNRALALTEYLFKETEYIPWMSALKSFSFIDLMLNDNSSLTEHRYLKEYLIKQLTPLYKSLGFQVSQNETHMTTLLRRSVLLWLCKYEYAACVDTAKAMFNTWMNSSSVNSIDPNLREVVYTTGVRLGGPKEWNFLWERFLEVKVDSERLKLIYALGVSTDEDSIKRYLYESLNRTHIRLQDVVYVYRAIGGYAPGRRFQFDWLLENWDEIKKSFQARFDDYMFNLISGYADAANTEAEISRLEKFLEDKNSELGSVVSDIKRSIEKAKINQKWTQDNKDLVSNWLKDKTEDETTDDSSGTSSTKSYSSIVSLFLICSMLSSIKQFL